MAISKKIFLASLVIFLTVLLFWGIYFLSFKKSAVQTNAPATNSSTFSFGLGEKMSALSDQKTSFPALSADGTAINFFSPDSEKLSQIGLDGKSGTSISAKTWTNLSGIFWSPGKTKAIIKSAGSNNQPEFSFFDLAGNQVKPLKSNLDMVVWQNDSKILYKYYDPQTKERSLNIADSDGANWKKIADLEFKNVFIAPIPKTGFITYWNRGGAQEETQLISVPIIGGEKKTLFKGKFGADYLWNNNGSKILMSHSNAKGGNKMELALLDDKGENYRGLEIPTFLSKCAWSSDNSTIYYALPGNILDNSILPDDYLAGKFNTTDTFWKMDTASGKKERIVELSDIKEQIDAKDLFLNEDESALFFVNKIDGKLYRINL